MNKKTLAVLVLLAYLLIYLFAAFVKTSFDIRIWDEMTRFLVVFIWFIVTFITVAFYVIENPK